jgi:hypothetical protein
VLLIDAAQPVTVRVSIGSKRAIAKIIGCPELTLYA